MLVFGSMDQGMKRLAQKAADEFIKNQLPPATYVSVYRFNPALDLVQGFTADRSALKKAVRKTLSGQPGSSPLQILHGLTWLITQQETGPGRKTLIFFSYGLRIPVGLDHVLQALVSVANSRGFATYGVDVRGLDLSGDLEEARRILDQTGDIISRQNLATSGGRPIDTKQDEALDRSFKGNPLGILEDLATQTGGFVITHTNDFSKGMRRIGAEICDYHIATYTPTATTYDGAYRKWRVEVTRPGTQVHARDGYFALPPSGPPPQPHEVPLLATLTADSLPADMEAASAVYRFRLDQKGSGDEHFVIVSTPLAQLKFQSADEKGETLRGRLTALAQFKNSEDEVVQKVSQDWPLGGTREQVEQAKRNPLLLVRRVKLEPGEYTFEGAVRDGVAGTVGAWRRPLRVPGQGSGIAISSLAVGPAVEAQVDPDPTDPFRYKSRGTDLTVIPNLGRPIPKGTESLLLYCVVYPDESSKETSTVTISILQGTQVLATASAPLPTADAQGRIPYASTMPFGRLPTGEYSIRVVAQQGASSATSQTTVIIR
jgi:VWFA-related protein